MTRLRLIMLAVLSAALAGCLLIPGRFDSGLDLNRDGTFHFRYAGELVFLPLTQAMKSQMANRTDKTASGTAPSADQAQVFTEETCTNPQTGEARACTADELAAQRRAWDQRKGAVPKGLGDAQAGAMMAMLGGTRPDDPQAPAAFADALRRQAGWRKVIYKGDGVFEVEYDVAGRLDHDFVFPTLEHMPIFMPMIMVTRHADGAIRVEAPGFAPGLGQMSALGAGLSSTANSNALKGLPPMSGTFAITADGAILANNTEDGPAPAAGGAQRLTWKIGGGRATAPTALIRPN